MDLSPDSTRSGSGTLNSTPQAARAGSNPSPGGQLAGTQVPGASGPASPTGLPQSSWRRPSRIYAVATVVVAVIVIVAAIAIIDGVHRKPASSSGQVVTAEGTIYYIPVGQYNAISVTPSVSSILQGSFKCTYPVTLYTMDGSQFQGFVEFDKLNYTWTFGPVQNNTVIHFSAPIPAASTSLVFVDPSNVHAVTLVFYSNVTLTPS